MSDPIETVWQGRFITTLREGRWEYVMRNGDITAAVIVAIDRKAHRSRARVRKERKRAIVARSRNVVRAQKVNVVPAMIGAHGPMVNRAHGWKVRIAAPGPKVTVVGADSAGANAQPKLVPGLAIQLFTWAVTSTAM